MDSYGTEVLASALETFVPKALTGMDRPVYLVATVKAGLARLCRVSVQPANSGMVTLVSVAPSGSFTTSRPTSAAVPWVKIGMASPAYLAKMVDYGTKL